MEPAAGHTPASTQQFDHPTAAQLALDWIDDTELITLEDLGGGLGLTDPVSGESVARLAAARRPTKRSVPVRRKTARETHASARSARV